MRSVLERMAGGALILGLSPIFLVIAAGVRFTMGKPVLFKQKRTGYRGRAFDLYKFRTMREMRHPDGRTLPDEDRLTPFGRFLRRFSLDELPQLINVISGEVAFVGPRPLMHKYWVLNRYSAEQARRFEVKPGLTGWVQVNGRNSLSWEEKFELDVWYVDNRSAWLDVQILGRTFSDVLRGRGVNEDGLATTSEFRGSPGKPARQSTATGTHAHLLRE